MELKCCEECGKSQSPVRAVVFVWNLMAVKHEHISTNTHRCVLQPGGVHRERETEELLQHIRPHSPRVGKVHC